VPFRFAVAAILGIVAIVVGLTGSHYLPTTAEPKAAHTSKPKPTPSPKVTAAADPLPTTEPAPPLLDKSDIAPVATLVSSQQDQTATLLKTWWSTHGTDVDDDAFVTWAAQQIPAPPTSFVRSQELSDLATRIGSRSSADLKAARWLDRHADADGWELLRKQQAALNAAGDDAPTTTELRAAVDLATRVAKLGSERLRQPAPYVVNAALRDNQKAATSTTACPCSYPSQIVARSAAARRYLGDLSTHRRSEYVWFEAQVDTSQLLRGQAARSDIAASAFIGDLVGRYVLVTRGHAKP
jgi:hypothetical protein